MSAIHPKADIGTEVSMGQAQMTRLQPSSGNVAFLGRNFDLTRRCKSKSLRSREKEPLGARVHQLKENGRAIALTRPLRKTFSV
jgi:hypothetical protein